MTSLKCPICGCKNLNLEVAARDNRNRRSKTTYKYFKCNDCGSLILDPKSINKNFYKKAYGTSYYLEKRGIIGEFEKWFSDYTNNLKKGLINKYTSRGSNVSVIDIGSGNLNFLKSLDKKKYIKFSIDINSPKIKYKDIESITGDFDTYNFGEQQFDLATAWHVIEHIPEPKVFFRKLKSILTKNGIAVISTPLLDSLGYKLAKSNWYHLDAPRHMILFNEKSLVDVSRNSGFELLATYKPVLEFPFDLLKSIVWSGKFYLLPLYPLLKVVSNETMFVVLRKL